MESYLINNMRNNTWWDFERLEYVKMLSIREAEDYYTENFMKTGVGKSLQPFAVKCFEVHYEISYEGGFGSGEESGKHVMFYYVVKVDEDSPWQIADMGV